MDDDFLPNRRKSCGIDDIKGKLDDLHDRIHDIDTTVNVIATKAVNSERMIIENTSDHKRIEERVRKIENTLSSNSWAADLVKKSVAAACLLILGALLHLILKDHV